MTPVWILLANVYHFISRKSYDDASYTEGVMQGLGFFIAPTTKSDSSAATKGLYVFWKLYLILIFVYTIVDLATLLNVYSQKSKIDSLSDLTAYKVCYIKDDQYVSLYLGNKHESFPVSDYMKCFTELLDRKVDYVVALRYDLEKYWMQNSVQNGNDEGSNDNFPYHVLKNQERTFYLIYNATYEKTPLISQLLNDIEFNIATIIKGRLDKFHTVQYKYNNETVLYNSTIWIYIGLSSLGIIAIFFVIKLFISELHDLSGKRTILPLEVSDNLQSGPLHEEEEKVSLNLPASNSRIEIINFAGAPEDGFIQNDNVSSKVSGGYKYSNTDEFERQVSQIVPNQGAAVSGNVPNNSAQDLLSFVKQFPGAVPNTNNIQQPRPNP